MSLTWFLARNNLLMENVFSNVNIKRVPREIGRVPRIREFWFEGVLILTLVFPVPHHTTCFGLGLSFETGFLVVPMGTTVPASLVVLS